MFKKILLGTAIATVFSTACYAQNPTSPPDYYQKWFNTAQSAYNNAKDEPCEDFLVYDALLYLKNIAEPSMSDWVIMAGDTLIPTDGTSNLQPKQASLDALSAQMPAAEGELSQVRSWIKELSGKKPCDYDKPANSTPGAHSVGLTPQEADGLLRVLLGVPSREVEKHLHELEKTLKDDPEAHKDLLNGDGKKADQQAPKTDSKVDSRTDTKTDDKADKKADSKVETNPEHSQRSVTPEKSDTAKQVARTNPVEAHQAVSHITPNAARISTARSFGSIHSSGFAAMHTGGLGGMHMAGIGGMRMGGFGGMHMGGFGGMHMGGGMHFGRM